MPWGATEVGRAGILGLPKGAEMEPTWDPKRTKFEDNNEDEKIHLSRSF